MFWGIPSMKELVERSRFTACHLPIINFSINMARRSLGFRKVHALNDLRKLEQLTALESQGKRAFPDATCEVPGTGPEKLVYNYLQKLRVRFQFQYHQEDYEETARPEELYIPDFILPDYNIKIEVFGEYWHSMPHRRDSDLRKWARHLFAGNMIIEHGIPTFPESGGATGKYVIWWATEIYAWLSFLFQRDLPELFSTDRIKGTPDEVLLDRDEEIRKMRARIGGMAAKRIKPKMLPFQRETRRLRREQTDITRVYPILRKLERERKQRIPKEFRIKQRSR